VKAAAALRARVPSEILVLITAVAVGGTVAGYLAATPLLFFTSPVVAAGLATAAVWAPLSVRVLSQLPDSQARELLLDLLRRADIVASRARVKPLVSAACEAARQLYVLETHVALGADERCRRSKEMLARRLRDASAALTRWEASEAWQIDAELAELTAQLEAELIPNG
jgi:hypothetical protein